MGILDRFKKKTATVAPGKDEKKSVKKVTAAKLELKAKDEKKAEPNSGLKLKAEVKAPTEAKGKKVSKENTKRAYKILIRPLVTEKATALVAQNKYSFAVANEANKIEVKKAIKSLYGYEPLDVNIIIMRGKNVQSGKVSGRKKRWKKAIVTLKPGEKIEIYEGV